MEKTEKYRKKYRIPSARAKWHDYNSGVYFITICTKEKRHYFGEISDGEMHLTPLGKYTAQCIDSIPQLHPEFDIYYYTIMPNHLHIVIATYLPKLIDQGTRGGLSRIIQSFKRTVTIYARDNKIDFEWQERFHDHIVRNKKELKNILQYVANNVEKWAENAQYHHKPWETPLQPQ